MASIRLRFIVYLVSLLYSLFLIPSASAQSHEWWQRWRRDNDQGNRYEGFIEIPTGEAELEVISFLGCREPFEENSILKVRFYLPTAGGVSITAKDISERHQYWMESKTSIIWKKNAWNEFGPWETEKVIDEIGPANIRIGILVRPQVQTKYTAELLPAFLYHSIFPPEIDTYFFTARTKYTIRTLSYRTYRLDETQEILLGRPHTVPGDLIAEEPFTLEIDTEELVEGQILLVVEGTYKNRLDGLHEEYWFYHKPL